MIRICGNIIARIQKPVELCIQNFEIATSDGTSPFIVHLLVIYRRIIDYPESKAINHY